MATSYRKLTEVSEELQISAVRYDKNLGHPIYIWKLEPDEHCENKVKILLYQCNAGNARPLLIFSKMLTKIQMYEDMTPKCLVDEIGRKVYILCYSHNRNKKLTLMEMPVNYDASNIMTIGGPTKIYTGMPEHELFDNHVLFFHPEDGSIMRHVQLFNYNLSGKIKSDFRVEWFELDAGSSRVEKARSIKAGSKHHSSALVRTWAPIQFCHKASTLILMYTQMADCDFFNLSNRVNPTFNGGHLPDFAIFKLDSDRKAITMIRSLPMVQDHSPGIFRDHFQKRDNLMATCIVPIGQAYKYSVFHLKPKRDNLSFDVVLGIKSLYESGIKSLYESVNDFDCASDLLSYLRIRYSSLFSSEPEQFFHILTDDEKQKINDNGLRAGFIGHPLCINGELITIAIFSDSLEKRVSFDLSSYKDYRKCAACGMLEKKKRRNKNGSRISDFKVCRICKECNFHWKWWTYPCHYCSLECMKKDWKKHKKIHERPKLVSKITETLDLVEIDPELIET